MAIANIATADIFETMTTDKAAIDSLLPLPLATFHILMSLSDGEMHGYGIILDVSVRTGGALKMSAGTLYRSIQRMQEQGLIVEVLRRRRADDDERRRYYRITLLGAEVARAEASRLSQLVRMARARGFTPERAG